MPAEDRTSHRKTGAGLNRKSKSLRRGNSRTKAIRLMSCSSALQGSHKPSCNSGANRSRQPARGPRHPKREEATLPLPAFMSPARIEGKILRRALVVCRRRTATLLQALFAFNPARFQPELVDVLIE